MTDQHGPFNTIWYLPQPCCPVAAGRSEQGAIRGEHTAAHLAGVAGEHSVRCAVGYSPESCGVVAAVNGVRTGRHDTACTLRVVIEYTPRGAQF